LGEKATQHGAAKQEEEVEEEELVEVEPESKGAV